MARMAAESRKRKREEETSPACLVYLIDKKISSGHLNHLKTVAKKKGFSVSPTLSEEVTHIVTALPTYEKVVALLNCSIAACGTITTEPGYEVSGTSDTWRQSIVVVGVVLRVLCLPHLHALCSELPQYAEVVSLEWLTTSFIEEAPATVTDHYRLKNKLQNQTARSDDESSSEAPKHPQVPEYECQRVTLLKHHNHAFTDALELLERFYYHLDYKQGDTRALAFRQASCALKALPREIKHIDDVSSLHRVGRHSKQVIKEILENGFSSEVEDCKHSEWFKSMEAFCSVYGCGSATADKWYHSGLQTVEQVHMSKDLQFTEIQKLGLKYHEQLSQPVTREETEHIVRYFQTQANHCFSGTTVEAVGGYRRGKPHGHDVDLLLSHPETNITDVLLENLLACLRKNDVLIHADVSSGFNTLAHIQHSHVNSSRHSYTPDGKQRRVKFDYLDKAFCIIKLHRNPDHHPLQQQESKHQQEDEFLIRRVDLIVSPPNQYHFALVSWTGSKQFNRSLRRYAAKELNMSVTAHGIYDNVQQKFIPAGSEQDIFTTLKLTYLEPWQRNC